MVEKGLRRGKRNSYLIVNVRETFMEEKVLKLGLGRWLGFQLVQMIKGQLSHKGDKNMSRNQKKGSQGHHGGSVD